MFRHGWLIAVFPVAASLAAVAYPVRVDAPSPCESLGTISPAHGWAGDIQPDDRYCLHVPLEEGALARLHLAVDSGIVDVELWPPGSEDPLLVLGVGYGLDPPRPLTWKAEVGGSYHVLLRGVGPERDGRGYPGWGVRVTVEDIVPPEVQAATDARLAADPRTRWLAEHAIPLRSISPGDDDYADLASLRGMLGNVRLVHLGVGDPGAGADFLALTRLIRFLHEEMGFDVLVFESGIYDLARAERALDEGMAGPAALAKGLFPFFAESRELRPLAEYLAAPKGRPITVAGFDFQFTSGADAMRTFLRDVVEFLETRGIESPLLEPESDANGALRSWLAGLADGTPGALDRGTGEMLIATLLETAQSIDDAAEGIDRLWGQILRSTATLLLAHHNAGYPPAVRGPDSSPAAPGMRPGTMPFDELRDRQMATNLLWIAREVHPSAKIMTLGTNYHMVRDREAFPRWARKGHIGYTMGGGVAAALGDQVFAIGATSHSGSRRWASPFSSRTDIVADQVPSFEFEELMAAAGHEYALVDLRAARESGLWLGGGFYARPYGHVAMRMRWSDHLDALLFIREERAATMVRIDDPPEAAGPPAAPLRPNVLLRGREAASRAERISFNASEGTALGFDLSPDGRWIVLDLLGQLWRLPSTGGEAVALTSAVRDTAEDLDPSISPDGRWIVFQAHRGEASGLWLLPFDGSGQPRQVPGSDAPWRYRYSKPVWSPDSRQIAFTSGAEIRVHDIDRGDTWTLREAPGPVTDLVWIPTTGRLLYRAGEGWRPEDGNGVWRLESGSAGDSLILRPEVGAVAPAVEPLGQRLAFFAPDEQRKYQVWTRDLSGSARVRITDMDGVTPLRLRWTPDGEELLFSAAGKLWRVPTGGGEPRNIPFVARVEFERRTTGPEPVRLAEPGAERWAAGQLGIALAPDGRRMAIVALGALWVWAPGEEAERVTDLPPTARGVTWSPDGLDVAWSAEDADGTRNLFASRVSTGTKRRLTELPGRAERPVWSPAGDRLAFVHGVPGAGLRLAVIRPSAATVSDTMDVVYLDHLRGYLFTDHEHEAPSWSPLGEALLIAGAADAPPRIVRMNGSIQALRGLPIGATTPNWIADSVVVFGSHNRLWQARLVGDSVAGLALLTGDPAIFATGNSAGSLLHISGDGYHVSSQNGTTRGVGWPLSYQVPVVPPLLVRDVRLLDGTGAAPTALQDVLLERGRIARISAAGLKRPPEGVRVLDAAGRIAMPGLIDAHYHVRDHRGLAGLLFWGITSALDLGSPIGAAAAWADAIESGQFPGPRIVLGGWQFVPGADWSVPHSPRIQIGGSATANAGALALLRAFGGTYLKMYVPGTLAESAALITQTRRLGLRVGGHCAHYLPLIAAGIDHKHHLGPACSARADGLLHQDLVELFRTANVAVVPTLTFWSGPLRIQEQPDYLGRAGITDFLSSANRTWITNVLEDREYLAWLAEAAATARLSARRLHRGGVVLAAGSDFFRIPGSLHWELEELVGAGMSPLEALTAGTATAARILGIENQVGTLEVGKRADLVILDADPLVDIRNTRRIWHVIQGGKLVDRAGLIEAAAGSSAGY